jgi:hypothetical protein
MIAILLFTMLTTNRPGLLIQIVDFWQICFLSVKNNPSNAIFILFADHLTKISVFI